jgi:hypothetical protein
MDAWVWIVSTIAVIVVIAAVAVSMARKRMTSALREQFGPEFDRTVGLAENLQGR